MSNQILLWSMGILPWLTLFLMKKENIKRFLTVGLIACILVEIVIQGGIRTGLWVIRETTFPLVVIPTYAYGIYPVVTMWIFWFAYGHIWKYVITELVGNFLLVVLLLPWIASRGIVVFNTPLITYFIANGLGALLYIYQMWQEDALVPAVKNLSSTKVQPVARKPFSKDEDNKDNR